MTHLRRLPILPSNYSLLVVVGLVCWFAAGPVSAQIYDERDLLSNSFPDQFFGGGQYVTNEQINNFIAGNYASKSERRSYRIYLNDTLIPAKATLADDLDFQKKYTAALLWTDKPNEALPILQELEKKLPQDRDVAFNLAVAYEMLGFPDRALKQADRGLALNQTPANRAERMRRARLIYKQRVLEDPEWGKTNNFQPYLTKAWNSQGLPPNSFKDLNPPHGFDSAIRDMMICILHEPDFADAWVGFGMLIERGRGKKFFTVAYKIFNKALENDHIQYARVRAHNRALESLLPAGYSFGSKLWIGIKQAMLAGLLVVIILSLNKFVGGRGTNIMKGVVGWWQARRARKWRADNWQNHHLDSLHAELDSLLGDDDPKKKK
jgi:tetratricopeptide (TPR) repeat protein